MGLKWANKNNITSSPKMSCNMSSYAESVAPFPDGGAELRVSADTGLVVLPEVACLPASWELSSFRVARDV